MTVSDILKNKGEIIFSLPVDAPVASAAAMLAEKRIGAVLVLDHDGKIAGILSERDMVRALNTCRGEVFNKTVSDLMTRDVVTCTPETTIPEIMGIMTTRRFRHVPVLDGDRIAGIVSIGDVVKSRIEEAEAEVDALRRYIAL